MTQTEMNQLAQAICTLTPSEYEVFGSLLFDKIEQSYTAVQVQQINAHLLILGVDVGPLCKKKHPQ